VSWSIRRINCLRSGSSFDRIADAAHAVVNEAEVREEVRSGSVDIDRKASEEAWIRLGTNLPVKGC
jgi:purine nucleoside permease